MAEAAITERTEGIRRLKEIVDRINDPRFREMNIHQVRVRRERFISQFAALEQQNRLVIGYAADEAERGTLRTEFYELEEKALDAQAVIDARIKEMEQEAAPQPPVAPAQQNQPDRPFLAQNVVNTWGKYDGKTLKWLDFKSRFKIAVHDVEQIKPDLKMQFLRQSLTGMAEEVALGFTVTAENYDKLWQALIDKFEDKYAMSCAYLSKFFGLPTLQEPITSNELTRMVTTTNEMLRQLKEMDYCTDNWDLVVVHALQERLIQPLTKEWNDAHKGVDLPTIDMMIKFLEDQAKNIGSTDFKKAALQVKLTNEHVQRTASRQPSGAVARVYKCGVCSAESHATANCPEFAPLTYNDRKRTAAMNRLCFVCLKRGHFVHECYTLKRCQEQRCKNNRDTNHHEMLCPVKNGSEYVNTVRGDGRTGYNYERKRNGDAS